MSNLNIDEFFKNPSGRQKQYEAIRSIFVDNFSYAKSAKKFGYEVKTLHTMVSDVKKGRLNLFPEIKTGPNKRRVKGEIQDRIINYRNNNNFSNIDIFTKLKEDKINISIKTIERILKDAGFEKLKRRTHTQRGLTLTKKIIPEISEKLNIRKLKKFKVDCPIAGIYLFIPYIIESGLIEIIKKSNLPKSSVIDSVQACLSMLILKLIGNERITNMDRYDHEPGLGVFAGLNILPKATYMGTYSCRTSEEMLINFQEKLLKKFMNSYPHLYDGEFINLDFHSIPHYGDESNMEKVWCGTKNKAIKGANTVFAQDSKNNMIVYTRTDILRKEESEEIKNFVEYWKKITGNVEETLVFDCRFTNYKVLNELAEEGIKFITLRKRTEKIINMAQEIPEENWKKVKIQNLKRKYKNVNIYENEALLTGCSKSFRQIIIKDHGRENPTFIITNNNDLQEAKVLEVYAKRWRIENKISEIVSFFNINALSSPLMIRIHFDVLFTFIGDTLYHIFAKDLRRFEHHDAKTIFRKFIDIPGKVVYDGDKFQIRMRKRAHTPILKSIAKLNKPFRIPWLNNKEFEIIWTA